MNRTNTTTRTEFNLSLSGEVRFDFSQQTIQITIPVGSTWYMPYHWHDRILDMKWIGVEAGELCVIQAANRNGRTSSVRLTNRADQQGVSFKVTDGVAWKSARLDTKEKTKLPLVVNLDAEQNLHRNICSAILDKDLFPSLASTPYWVRLLCAIPALRPRLIDRALWIQLQAIYWKHDFRVSHGEIPFAYPWVMWPFGSAPDWATEAQIRSRWWISSIVMSSAYWTGRLLLGMKGEYPQYSLK